MPDEDEFPSFLVDGWDGARPHPAAEAAVYPVSEEKQQELKAAYRLGDAAADEYLPDEIWADVGAAISIHRAIVEERRCNRRPADTRKNLAEFSKKLRQTAGDIDGHIMNDAARPYFTREPHTWQHLKEMLVAAADRVQGYVGELAAVRGQTGPDWRHQQMFVATLQRILLRHKRSLLSTDVRTGKKTRRTEFLQKIFEVADDKISETRASRLIRTIARHISLDT
ncbi:hypothetical protein [Methylobacterium durans]|nr:hypothetical protein [Methylobacterium durans]